MVLRGGKEIRDCTLSADNKEAFVTYGKAATAFMCVGGLVLSQKM